MDNTKKQLDVLTGLRGLAAYSVLIGHAISSSFLYSGVNPLQPFAGRLAMFGMSLFFVLSGFVIYYNYADKINTLGYMKGGYQFIAARISRLFPLYALIIVLMLDGIPSGYFHNKQWDELAYLTMTQSWFNKEMTFFPPLWSISTEWFFYYAFLLMMPLLNLVKRPMLIYILFLITAFILLPNFIELEINQFGNANGWATYFSPLTRIFDFLAGVLGAKVYLSFNSMTEKKTSLLTRFLITPFIAWCVLIVFFDSYNPLTATRYAVLQSNFIYTPAISSAILLLCLYEYKISRILSNRFFIFMGEISYSVYLLGFMIMTGLGAIYISKSVATMSYINSCIKLISITTFTTFIAYGCYQLFEKPSRKWMRKALISSRSSNSNAINKLTINPSDEPAVS